MRIFAIVTESETLTHAAQRLGITQSGVSQALKQLEEHIGVSLIIKRSRPIKPTPSGMVLKEYANSILADTSRMMNDVKMASKGGLSSLSVGMIDSFGDAMGLQFISDIKPYVSKVSLSTGLNTSLTQSLTSRDIDLLFTSDQIDHEPNIVRHALIRDPFLVIAPKKSARDRSTHNIKEIARSLPFIHYSPNSQIGVQTDLIARRIGVELNTHYELDSTQTLMRFVKAKHGWAIISALCLVRYSNLLNDIDVINLNNGSNARFISQVCRKNELGELPEKFAEISRNIYTREVGPRLKAIAPWLVDQAYTINSFPPI